VDDDVRAGKSPGQRLVLELGLAEADIVPPRPAMTDATAVPALVQGPRMYDPIDLLAPVTATHRPSARDRRGLRVAPMSVSVAHATFA
jgi:hypothetical protein